jgi:hypothetical protein
MTEILMFWIRIVLISYAEIIKIKVSQMLDEIRSFINPLSVKIVKNSQLIRS